MNEKLTEISNKIAKTYADKGGLVEAGWRAFRVVLMPQDASLSELEKARIAFYAGAQHLFASMINAMDPEMEPTEADMRRMDLLNAEMERFKPELEAAINKAMASEGQ